MCKSIKPYLVSIAISLAFGGVSAFFSGDIAASYQTLKKPPLSPGAIVFPIVWTCLFLLMGISAAMIFCSAKPNKTEALRIYFVQLCVNFFWPILFFSFERRLFSFFWLILLVILVIIMIKRFYSISKVAALLQLPYLIWLLFAAYLNFGVYWLNK